MLVTAVDTMDRITLTSLVIRDINTPVPPAGKTGVDPLRYRTDCRSLVPKILDDPLAYIIHVVTLAVIPQSPQEKQSPQSDGHQPKHLDILLNKNIVHDRLDQKRRYRAGSRDQEHAGHSQEKPHFVAPDQIKTPMPGCNLKFKTRLHDVQDISCPKQWDLAAAVIRQSSCSSSSRFSSPLFGGPHLLKPTEDGRKPGDSG